MSTFGLFQPPRMPSGSFSALRARPPVHATPAFVPPSPHPMVRRGFMPGMPGGWRPQPGPTTIIVQQPAPIAPVAQPVATYQPSPPIVVPPSMPAPQPDVSPASPTADLGPTQDAAEAAAAPPPEHPGHAIGRKVIIGLVVVGVAFGGYKLYQKHKKHAPSGHGHSNAMHGFRRRRRRR